MSIVKIIFLLIPLVAVYSTSSAQGTQAELLSRINNLRRSVGATPYAQNGTLDAAAQSQAQWMADTAIASHTRPDGSSPRSRAGALGYPTNWISENIYFGNSGTTIDNAWRFWINSPIHYAGLTSPNYTEVGIGIARGENGNGYALVFGNPNVRLPERNVSAGTGNTGNQNAAPAPRVLEYDDAGNIIHTIEVGETIGEIALIYGYTWDDIPAILAVNGMGEEDVLSVGETLLVPPEAGTNTPTPEPTPTEISPTQTPLILLDKTTDEPEPTPQPQREEQLIEPAAFQPSATPRTAVSSTLAPTLAATEVAVVANIAPTEIPPPPTPLVVNNTVLETTPEGAQFSIIVLLIISVQVGVLLFAGAEFLRRRGR